LEVSQKGNWTEWVVFFLRGVAEQSADAIQRSNRLRQLATQYREKLQVSRSSATLLKLTDHLFLRPVINVSSAMTVLKLSQPSAQANIDRLVREGISVEVTGRQRGRIYVADKIIAVVEEEEEIEEGS
jgi:Fic family protein